MHLAFLPQMVPSQGDLHWPVAGSSMKPLLHLHQAAWSSGLQLALVPHGSDEQGLEHWRSTQASWPGQSLLARHSSADLGPRHPAE